MADPRVAIELALEPKDISAVISEVSSKIKSGLGSIAVKAVRPGDMLAGISTSLEKFRTFETTIGGAINNAINSFYRFKRGVAEVTSGSIAVLKGLPDFLDDKLYRSINKSINTFYKIKNAAENVFGTITSLTAKDVFYRMALSAKHLQSAIANIKIKPGAFLDAFKGFSTRTLTTALKAVQTSVNWTLLSFRKLGQGAINLGSNFLGLAGKVKNFVFSLKGLAAAAGVGAAFYGIFNTAAVAEDVERAQWKFNTVFNEIGEKANKTAKGIADTFSVNIGSIQSQMARSADVVKPLGLDQNVILEMTRNIGLLSQGAEAWTEGRYDAERASTAMMKALTGEKEMLKEFGVVITDQEVWNAIKSQGKEMTRANFAIAIYNKILERTPDLQRAAFDRIKEFTGRLSQFKESFKTLRAAIGDFTKPIVTAFLHLGGVVNRKLAEILGSEGFAGWKEAIDGIAAKIEQVAQGIEQFDITNISGEFKKVTDGIGAFTTGAVEAIGAIFVPLGIGIGKTLEYGLKKGIIEGVKSGVAATPPLIKAMASDFSRAAQGDVRFYRDLLMGKKTSTELALADMGRMPDWEDPFKGIGTNLYNDITKAFDEGLKHWSQLGDGITKVIPRQGFGKDIPLTGPQQPISEEDKLKLRRMDDALWRLSKQEGFIRADMEKAGKDREASMVGLKDAYFAMLTRAAGGKKDAATSIEKLQFKLEDIEKKKERESERRKILLEKIEANTKMSGREIFDATYRR